MAFVPLTVNWQAKHPMSAVSAARAILRLQSVQQLESKTVGIGDRGHGLNASLAHEKSDGISRLESDSVETRQPIRNIKAFMPRAPRDRGQDPWFGSFDGEHYNKFTLDLCLNHSLYFQESPEQETFRTGE
jgi:hypothetical protein